MATLTLTGSTGSLLRMAQELKAALAIGADNRTVSVTLDDSDFSVTYTDGVYGSKKKVCK